MDCGGWPLEFAKEDYTQRDRPFTSTYREFWQTFNPSSIAGLRNTYVPNYPGSTGW